MLKLVALFVVFLGLAVPTVAARADLRPPPRVEPTPAYPIVHAWIAASVEAMKQQDRERAAALCDPRGYSDNLVGGSGTSLERLFSQGAKKRWHLRIDNATPPRTIGKNMGYIVHAFVVDNDSDERLDALYLLLVTREAGGSHHLALGAGEELAQVEALVSRYLTGVPLAPPPEPTPAP
jgi:hypothetical protein